MLKGCFLDELLHITMTIIREWVNGFCSLIYIQQPVGLWYIHGKREQDHDGSKIGISH